MRILLAIIGVVLFPVMTFAAGMTKQEACAYPDGIQRSEVYVLWPGKIAQIDDFLKKDGFLYYFIQTFDDRVEHIRYRDSGDIARNTGSYFVSFDCARSRVRFYPTVQSRIPYTYGKLNAIDGNILNYSLVSTNRDPCTTGPDSLLDISRMTKISPDRLTGVPRSTNTVCVGRSYYKSVSDAVVQFDIESHTWKTEESFYSRYQYSFVIKKLKKIR